MKLIVLFISVFSFLNFEKNELKIIQNEENCIVFLENGTKMSGNIELPIKSGSKYITLKVDNKKEKVELQTVDKIEVTISGAKIQYHNLKVFNFSGKKIKKDKQIMLHAIKGKVNLYIGTLDWSATINAGNGWQQMNLNGVSYYCIREGEEAATLIHENFGQVNKNADFKLYASRYFSDNETILKKNKK
jgi:hypothetical protein